MRRWVTAFIVAVLLASAAATTPANAAQGPAARPDPARQTHLAMATVSPSHTDRSVTETHRASAGRFVDGVEWIPDPDGRRLAVYPTDHARYDAPASDWSTAWAEVIHIEPEADYANMRDQFRCHLEFARIAEPHKPSWNLELWRADAGYLATVLARCNP